MHVFVFIYLPSSSQLYCIYLPTLSCEPVLRDSFTSWVCTFCSIGLSGAVRAGSGSARLFLGSLTTIRPASQLIMMCGYHQTLVQHMDSNCMWNLWCSMDMHNDPRHTHTREPHVTSSTGLERSSQQIGQPRWEGSKVWWSVHRVYCVQGSTRAAGATSLTCWIPCLGVNSGGRPLWTKFLGIPLFWSLL